MTQTETVLCLMPTCAGENEVEISFGWDPGQKASWDEWSGGTPPIDAGVEDVTCPDVTCEWCGYQFTAADRAKIEDEFEVHAEDA